MDGETRLMDHEYLKTHYGGKRRKSEVSFVDEQESEASYPADRKSEVSFLDEQDYELNRRNNESYDSQRKALKGGDPGSTLSCLSRKSEQWGASPTSPLDLRLTSALSLVSSVCDTSPMPCSFSAASQDRFALSDRASVISQVTMGTGTHSIPFSVFVIYIVAFISHWTQTLTEFITWFFIKARDWAPEGDNSYYGLIFGIFLFGPVLMNPTVGYLSERFAIKWVMIGANLVACTGIMLMVVAPTKVVYAIGSFLYACLAVRPLRTSYIAMATHPSVRTRAMAYLNLFTDGAKLVGVLTAKAWDRLAPPPTGAWIIWGMSLHSLNLCLLTGVSLLALNILIMQFIFKDETERSDRSLIPKIAWAKYLELKDSNGLKRSYNLDRHAVLITLYFCTIGFLHQISYGLVNVTNLPVLTNVFSLDEGAVANIKLLQDIIPAPSPLLVAQLSYYVSDRTIFVAGIGLALLGIGLFAAPLGAMMSWMQPLFGMVCISVSQQFFYTADFSIFSKVLGPRASSLRMAAVASSSAMGATVGAYVGGKFSVMLYGSFWFYALALPSVLACLMILNPWFFHIIAHDSVVSGSIVAQWKADEEDALLHPQVADP